MEDRDLPRRGELIMPFKVIRSADGPYEDLPYTAGFEMGRLYVLLEFGTNGHWEGLIRTPNYEQADLICMRFGYIIEFSRGDDHFTFIRVRKVSDVGIPPTS